MTCSYWLANTNSSILRRNMHSLISANRLHSSQTHLLQ